MMERKFKGKKVIDLKQIKNEDERAISFINDEYNIKFKEAKNRDSKINNTYPYQPDKQDISKEEENSIQDVNKYIFKKISFNQDEGLCTYLCKIGYEAFLASSKLDIAFLTVGKVLYKNKNIFNVPTIDRVVKKMKKDEKEKGKVIIGSNIHIWITLENGQIIDPSILHTLNKDISVIIGKAEKIKKENELIYEPYILFEPINLNQLYETNFKGIGENKFKKQIILYNAKTMNCTDKLENYY